MKLNRGFSLIELMIVVAIVGIIAAFAYPSYLESTAKSRRADAQSALMGLASAMERWYSGHSYSYTGAAAEGKDTGAPVASLFPSQAPLDSGTKYYDLVISAAASNTFTLQAKPIAGGAMEGDRCGTMQITSEGVRTAAETDCWR
ncbi:prepilin-type N-terminal cleavage/methylation domain-containing protein [Hahella sp. KA22]|uniref:type IV pilin protein n=1 Tax=Hahella sp. KA22 TaxID=1628392 RepID=UPI000FDEFC0D|nr:type IV pilin protein [Hahella sp. KA22]AZZ94359.1 type IV pilin protein [Hahella sp. KA22]QAY57733.1 prepilin-type N-terminal cleavage/methylation domain-containing protein [Hahella sp. KA22]